MRIRYFQVSGDILTAASQVVAVDDSITPSADDDTFRVRVAEAWDVKRFGREQDIAIESIVEVDENGRELPTT